MFTSCSDLNIVKMGPRLSIFEAWSVFCPAPVKYRRKKSFLVTFVKYDKPCKVTCLPAQRFMRLQGWAVQNFAGNRPAHAQTRPKPGQSSWPTVQKRNLASVRPETANNQHTHTHKHSTGSKNARHWLNCLVSFYTIMFLSYHNWYIGTVLLSFLGCLLSPLPNRMLSL